MAITPVADATFQSEVLDSSLPVLVDFTATWCGPCKALVPILEQVATEYDGRVKVVKADLDTTRETAMKYMVRSVPTLLVFKGGQVTEQNVGAANKSKIEKMLEKVL